LREHNGGRHQRSKDEAFVHEPTLQQLTQCSDNREARHDLASP
jgi:hypothetical protein